MEETRTSVYPSGTAPLNQHTQLYRRAKTHTRRWSRSISLMWSQGGQAWSQKDMNQHVAMETAGCV